MQSLDLAGYLAALPPAVKSDALSSPWTSQALFRALLPLAQQYVLRLLFLDEPVPRDSLELWVSPDPAACSAHRAAVAQLEALTLLVQAKPGVVVLHPSFQTCLRGALAGRGLAARGGQARSTLSAEKLRAVTAQAAKQWQAVLLHLLECDEPPPQPPAAALHAARPLNVQALLQSAGLITVHGRRHEATSAGLRYLLRPASEQVWTLLREYVRSAEAGPGAELASSLSFLLGLGVRRPGTPYPLSELSAKEADIAAHMAQLGLVQLMPLDGVPHFTVMPLAAALCGGGGAAAAAADATAATAALPEPSAVGGLAGIIVETNFRVYAHTSCPLQRRLLARLMRVDCLLPNLFVGTLTRESFRSAAEAGIGASDVRDFLAAHAHPQVARRVPCVPENVQDQLLLWEGESRRVVAEPAVLYSAFEDSELYEAAAGHADNLGVLLWSDAAQRALAVKRVGHDALRGFIVEFKAQRQRAYGGGPE